MARASKGGQIGASRPNEYGRRNYEHGNGGRGDLNDLNFGQA